MRKTLAISMILLLAPNWLVAQQSEMILHDQLWDLLEQVYEEDENADVEQLLSDLIELAENPISINNATSEDLAPLFFLSPIQIEALIAYRDEFGPVLSPFELSAVEGFNPVLAQLTAFFLNFVADQEVIRRRRIRQEILVRGTRLIEEQTGFENGKFEGSPEKLYLRYRFNSSRVQFGYIGEKDAGESFFEGENSKGFDYNSGFGRFEFGKKRSSVVLGDYIVQWGQGLVIWQGFAMGKSTDVDRISRFNQGIKPYSSTDENNHMRGLGADLKFGKFQFQPFISYKKFDANTDSIGDLKVFTSIQTSGLHRTVSEIEDKNSVAALNGGAHLSFNSGRFALGVSGVQTQFEYPLDRADDLYNQFLFEGTRVSNLALDYRCTFNRFYLFGETATSFGGLATINGFIFQPVGQVSFSALYRNISKEYNAVSAATFAENSRVNDEEGIFFGLRVFPAAKVVINAYADFFQYKWIKYTTAAPGKGHEYLIRADYNFNSNWQLYGRYLYEGKPLKESSDVIRYNETQIRQYFRAQLSGQLSDQFLIRTRFEHSFYEHDHNSDGWMISQDLGWQARNDGARFWLRLAYFNTDDYDSRIYAYENDLLYQFSIPAYYGEGWRSYISGKVKICEKIECWFKCSRTWYKGVNSLGSGDTAIDGSSRTEVKLQIRFKI
ncbi:ComEA family DNA-binding protein [Mangrovibacterium diazotrophicum]|uniref:DNA uptake protein ComE-like DNA-binding protein n=1 Tax=Mangrovibacterium diazotrophicum TaxID=1261403 RepID=A0A419VW32_9BACT|nr:helix-hairpin-helix domain-containing protein [Mangrovibacterium diazotrophicum]RKD86192.1 DNA uptake protein ComE-like DNA-binding protein [Mangrovibacterium diazotrophicum]